MNSPRRLSGHNGSRVHAANAIVVRPDALTKKDGPPGPIIPVAVLSSCRGGAGPRSEAHQRQSDRAV